MIHITIREQLFNSLKKAFSLVQCMLTLCRLTTVPPLLAVHVLKIPYSMFQVRTASYHLQLSAVKLLYQGRTTATPDPLALVALLTVHARLTKQKPASNSLG